LQCNDANVLVLDSNYIWTASTLSPRMTQIFCPSLKCRASASAAQAASHASA
jgi:hypothetical protein